MLSVARLQVIFVVVVVIALNRINCYDWKEEARKTTADRIRDHGYPAETHTVETEDNYLITMFRIPYSHHLQNQYQRRPAILLQHGLLSCSDTWILNGPNDALAFLLADAGYDVWMGNARGNRYSRNNTRLSTDHPYFWRFSWHEIGTIDIPAMIDHIIERTGEPSVHYTGHSQGTTVFLVMTATRPEYNQKISTAHMLAPVAFMSNMSNLVAKYTKKFLGKPSALTRLLDTQEILPGTLYYVELYETFCESKPRPFLCRNLYFLATSGLDESFSNLNMTIVQHINETHPAGASTNQVLHYMQEYESGYFRWFDHGERKNMDVYGQSMPPDYDVSQITANLHLYYADNDTFAAVIDVEYFISLLSIEPTIYHVPDPTFTHTDFIASMQVKEEINDRIISACDAYEQNQQR